MVSLACDKSYNFVAHTQMAGIADWKFYLCCEYCHQPYGFYPMVMTDLLNQKKTQILHNISGSSWLAKTSGKTIKKIASQSGKVLSLHQKCCDGEEKDGRNNSVKRSRKNM